MSNNLYSQKSESDIPFTGLSDGLRTDLQQLGLDPDDLNESEEKAFHQLHEEWGNDFSKKMTAIKEVLGLLPEETLSRYQKAPYIEVIHNSAFLRDVNKMLSAFYAEKQLEKENRKGGFKFKNMEERQRAIDLKDIQSQLTKIIAKHHFKRAHQAAQRGEPEQW